MRDRDCVTACRRSRPLRRRGEARLRARTPLRMKMPVTVWRRQSQCRKRYLQWRARYTCTAHFFLSVPSRVYVCVLAGKPRVLKSATVRHLWRLLSCSGSISCRAQSAYTRARMSTCPPAALAFLEGTGCERIHTVLVFVFPCMASVKVRRCRERMFPRFPVTKKKRIKQNRVGLDCRVAW